MRLADFHFWSYMPSDTNNNFMTKRSPATKVRRFDNSTTAAPGATPFPIFDEDCTNETGPMSADCTYFAGIRFLYYVPGSTLTQTTATVVVVVQEVSAETDDCAYIMRIREQLLREFVGYQRDDNDHIDGSQESR